MTLMFVLGYNKKLKYNFKELSKFLITKMQCVLNETKSIKTLRVT